MQGNDSAETERAPVKALLLEVNTGHLLTSNSGELGLVELSCSYLRDMKPEQVCVARAWNFGQTRHTLENRSEAQGNSLDNII